VKRVRGFTLIELLVSLGIMSILMGILIPSVVKARALAKQARVLSDMRQLLVAYSAYSTDHRGALLPGFLPDSAAQTVEDSKTGTVISGHAASRYPWRIMPYVKDWRLLFDGGPFGAGDIQTFAYQMSLLPRFGLNSVFVGGDHQFDGFYATGEIKSNSPAAMRETQVRNSSEMLVFVESGCYQNGKAYAFPAGTLPSAVPAEGLGHYFQAQPPRYRGSTIWSVENGKIRLEKNGILGAPTAATGNRPIAGFLDGHATTMGLEDLQDMRWWTSRVSERQ
jgi:prepilin-type N-terminal cleavage/methylation domain-containing protein